MKSWLKNSILACGREGPKIHSTGMGDTAVDCLPPVEGGGTPQEEALLGVFQRRPGAHTHRHSVFRGAVGDVCYPSPVSQL